MKLGLHVLLLVRVAQLRVRREVEVANLILDRMIRMSTSTH